MVDLKIDDYVYENKSGEYEVDIINVNKLIKIIQTPTKNASTIWENEGILRILDILNVEIKNKFTKD